MKKIIYHRRFSKKQRFTTVLLFIILILLIWIWLMVPRPLFNKPFSTVIESNDGQLLGARIADDGQWRFPQPDSIPEKFEKCLLDFEDQYFYYHPGINPVSLFRALILNIKKGEIVSGGSTITMQVCRIAREGKKRSYYNKLTEMLWALNLELRFSKSEILLMYAANAPFGGNVVGLDAASWRYFNRPPEMLSWSEAATLAVLPNAPSLIYPGKREIFLLEKRNRVLKNLLEDGTLDSLTYNLSLFEPLPDKVYPLPSNSYHLLERAVEEHKGNRIQTTINKEYQDRVTGIVESHHQQQKANRVFNQAVIIAEVKTGNVLAYVGNINDLEDTEHGNHVDIISSPRSTGSILKPFLYTAMMENGRLSPTMLLPDIPTRFGGFTPLNFDRQYDGAVRANEALARSLNVPAVRMLQDFGVEPFYNFLK
ncbi:MAG: transglycosylase domain-containing protein, partial [Prolixibacteraceae bacterium]|nr:transglycosylase domain-containing protein [Prolixibacteraceae bacterium]